MKKLSSLVVMIAVMISLLALLVGCGGTVKKIVNVPLPTFAPANQPTTLRPPLVIQFCDDDTGSYPRRDFAAANSLMASSLVSAVSANQGGVTLFATAITHNTFDPANTLNPAFKVPSIPAYDLAPTPVPTQEPQDPVTDPATATAVTSQTISGIIKHNQSVEDTNATIAKTKADVTQDTARLTSWKPTVDTIASSIIGCFQLAASRFQNQPGTKMVYIASDLENNTDVDYTQNFVTSKALNGAIVHVIYFVSPSAKRDQEKRALWCPFLKSAGAKTVLFSDPTSSPTLADVFNTDLTATSAC
jgi:hypothetical protein